MTPSLRPSLRTRHLLILAGSLVSLAAAAPALAQNALGDGRALDAGLSSSGNKLNTQVRDLNATMRQNNQVINGQAGGGRSFRGSMGYTATDEFRGSQAVTTDAYSFRRDAAVGALATTGVRSTDALRYQFGLITGRAADPNDYTSSSDSALTQLGAAASRVRGGAIANGTGVLNTIRSTAQFQSQSSSAPTLLAYLPADSTRAAAAVTSSPLRGIAVTPVSNDGDSLGLTGLERSITGVRDIGDMLGKTPVEIRREKEKAKAASGNLVAPIDQRLVPTGNAYDQIVSSLTQVIDTRLLTAAPVKPTAKPGDKPVDPNAKPDPNAGKPGWVNELDKLREKMKRDRAKAEEEIAAEKAAADRAAAMNPNPVKPEDDTVKFDDSLVDALRKIKPKVTDLVPKGGQGDAPADVYTQRMRDGQEKLAAGRFFEAEGAFTLALIAKPSDPLALAGRVNTQLGAGLFLSAASNLRSLIVDHPEMVNVRYGPELLPTAKRAFEISNQLKGDLTNPAAMLGSDGGLLLAFLGIQFNEPEWVEAGLKNLAEKTPKDRPEAVEFMTLVTKVWTTK